MPAIHVLLGAPQQSPNPSYEFAEAERLYNVVIGPDLEHQDPLQFFANRAKDDDRYPDLRGS